MTQQSISSVHVIGSQGLGGAESFFIRLVTALHLSGHPVHVICKPDSGVYKALSKTGVPLHTVKMGGVLDVFSYFHVSQIIHRIRPDIVQAYMSKASRFCAWRRDKNAVYVSRLGGFYKLKSFYRHYDAWIGNTKSIVGYLKDHDFPMDSVHWIPNFVDIPSPISVDERLAFKKGLGIDQNTKVVLALGRFVEKKGIDTFLRAAKELIDKQPSQTFHFLVLGEGPLKEELLSLANELEIRKSISWAGWQLDVWPWFAIADVFVCPSRHEPLGNVILEGWAAQKPVISTKTHGGTELITDNHNGLLVEINDYQAMAESIETLILNPERAESIAAQGTKTLLGNYSKAVVVDQYLSLYAGLIS